MNATPPSAEEANRIKSAGKSSSASTLTISPTATSLHYTTVKLPSRKTSAVDS